MCEMRALTSMKQLLKNATTRCDRACAWTQSLARFQLPRLELGLPEQAARDRAQEETRPVEHLVLGAGKPGTSFVYTHNSRSLYSNGTGFVRQPTYVSQETMKQ